MRLDVGFTVTLCSFWLLPVHFIANEHFPCFKLNLGSLKQWVERQSGLFHPEEVFVNLLGANQVFQLLQAREAA